MAAARGIPNLGNRSFTISAYTFRTRDDSFAAIFDQGDQHYVKNARISANFRRGYAAVANTLNIHDIHATILHQIGLDHEKLIYRHGGRDWRLTDVHGRVVKEIIA